MFWKYLLGHYKNLIDKKDNKEINNNEEESEEIAIDKKEKTEEEKEAEEDYIWKLEVLAIFYKKWNDKIIGGKVIDGYIKNGSHFILRRWEEELWGGKVTSLKIEQENVNEVKAGRECWVRVRTWARFKDGDVLEFYVYES